MLAQSSWLGPYIHNGKKPINPLDSHVKSSQLGVDFFFLEHIGQMYNKYTFDQHGLNLGDIQRTNKQKLGINSKDLSKEGSKLFEHVANQWRYSSWKYFGH